MEKGKKNKKNGKKKGDFSYESSLGGVRLMTSPFMRSRHALSKQITIWTELPKHINLASSVSLDINV